MELTFTPTGFPDLRSVIAESAESVTFEQTCGRPWMPAPCAVRGAPFVQIIGPNVWTTLSLTIAADGASHGGLVGASRSHVTGSTTTPGGWWRSRA